MAESALLPGHVAQGGSFTPQDATKFALDYLVPGTTGRAPGAPKPQTKREFIEAAPSVDDLKAESRAFKAEATASGVRVNPDSYATLAENVETAARPDRKERRGGKEWVSTGGYRWGRYN